MILDIEISILQQMLLLLLQPGILLQILQVGHY
jgi:hypothetical protein